MMTTQHVGVIYSLKNNEGSSMKWIMSLTMISKVLSVCGCPLPMESVPFWGVATRKKICCLHEWRRLRWGLSPTPPAALGVESATTSLTAQTPKYRDVVTDVPW